MLAARRKTVQSADKAAAAITRKCLTPKRFASSAHGHESHHHSGPKDESLGTTFWFAIGLIPATVVVYTASRPSKDGSQPALSRFIDGYSSWKDQWTSRNTLHTNMIEQAAHDRILINSSPGSPTVNLKFPEVFNTGSPHNVVAGQGPRSMDSLIAHYRKRNAEEDERTLKTLFKEA
ncbi:NADH-ubiquinone oxidoreductase 17.8 kDa subunit [Xylogone sp. PMI_703]|nr:NADH-ubiquinone oxidoreductase 17.8 kDa subunit [Xylogone sp. PMI_703]